MKPETLENSALLLRRNLGSVDFEEIERLRGMELTEEEFNARASATEAFWNHYFETVLKLKIQEQLEFIGKEATDADQWLFGRGTLNGMSLIKEWFEEQAGVSRQKGLPEDKPEET